jgi:hypothetical protein
MSEIITDKLTGKTSAGDVTITSEGGSATMQLQQGLAKAWMYETHAVVSDSLNVSSATDGGSGDTVMTFSSAMSNSNYANHGGGLDQPIGTNSGYMAYHAGQFDSGNRTTTTCNPRKGFYTSSGGFGDYTSSTVVFGNLA